MDDRTKTEDEIKKAEQHEALKQTFLRLLDDPQVQQKIAALVSRRLGSFADTRADGEVAPKADATTPIIRARRQGLLRP